MVAISIVIPHFDTPASLGILLSSIPQQDDIQVIVVDDHSSMDVADILCRHSSASLLRLGDGERYAGTARNKGIAASDGEYILFADSDDYFVEGAFDIIRGYLERNLDAVFFRPVSIKADGQSSTRHLMYEQLILNYIKYGDEAIRYRFFAPWSKLIRRKIFLDHEIKFDEVIASNDVMASLKMGFYSDRIEVSDEVIYCVVERDGSLTKLSNSEVVESRFDVFCRYNFFVRENSLPRYQLPVCSILSRAFKVSFVQFFSILNRSIHYQFPIFPSSDGWNRWIKRLF